MSMKQGANQIVDSCIGDKLIEARYIGQTKYFDAYTEITASLPLSFDARAAHALKDYRLYGDSDGSGVQTENKANPDNVEAIALNDKYGVKITGAGTWQVKAFDNVYAYVYARVYNSNNEWVSDSTIIVGPTNIMYSKTITLNEGDTLCIFDPVANSTEQDAKNKIRGDKIVAIKSDTTPASYIPSGYKIPILLQSGVTENLAIPTANNWRYTNGYNTTITYTTTGLIIDISAYAANSCVYELYSVTSDMIGNDYIISWVGDDNKACEIGIWDYSKTSANKFTEIVKDSKVITITSDMVGNSIACRFYFVDPGTYTINNFMLTQGSTAPSEYIPHRYTSNYDLFIGDTKLGEEEYVDYQEQKVWKQFEISGLSEPLCGIGEYKDTLDLSTGTVSRYIKKLVLTGTENWASAGTNNYFRITIGALYTVLNSYDLFCTHFVKANISGTTTAIGADVYNSGSSNSATLNIRPSGSMSLNAFKQFLADEYTNGTPVTVWYVLATPTTETITIPTGFTGTVEGFMSQSGTPTQAAPIYPTANGEKQPNDTYSVLTLQPTDPPAPLPAINAYKGENTLSSEETVGNVTVKGRINKPLIYGFHIDPSKSDPAQAVTYLADAVGMTPAAMGATTFSYGSWQDAFFMPKPCMLKFDGTVDYYLDPDDYSKKTDGTAANIYQPEVDGNAMMEWPLIWYKFVAGSTPGEGYFYCSNEQVDSDYKCWCNINSQGQQIPHFYTAIYNGCSSNSQTKLRSLSDKRLVQGNNGITTAEQEINMALGNNTTSAVEWYTAVFADRVLIDALLILMSKTLDSQGAYGRGRVKIGADATANRTFKEDYYTGTGYDQKGLFYGSLDDDETAVKVFGMENWWGEAFTRTAGLISSNGKYLYKLTYGTDDGSTASGYNLTGANYLDGGNLPSTSQQDVQKMSFGAWGFLPSVTTSDPNYETYYCENIYCGGNGYALFGGGVGEGYAAGASYLNIENAVALSYFTVSTTLSCKPILANS